MGTMNKKVYLLEDDTSICELVQCALEMSGIELSAYNTVYEFWAALEKSAPQVSCIMLSALGQETDKVRGLNLGADDYIAKPFGILELTARVNAALRRHGESAGIVRGDLALDEETMTATLRGVKLELNNKEFNLLKYLMQKEGKALSRENILNAVWGYDEGETRTVDNHVARLRKLGIDYIETVFGVGYKFVYRE